MGDVLFFLVMFAVVFFAFALMGNLMFGTVMPEFSSLWFSIESNSRMMLGENFFADQWDANQISAVVFFFLYSGIITLVMLNIFIGIICWHFVEQSNLVRVTFGDEVNAMIH